MKGHKPTWDQQRAMHSWEKVQEVLEKKKPLAADDYASYVTQLPISIVMNGLGQAVAQLRASAKRSEDSPHHWLYLHLQDWLCRDLPQTPYPGSADLLESLIKNDRKMYVWAVKEALAWLAWHKKLSTAHLKEREDADEKDD